MPVSFDIQGYDVLKKLGVPHTALDSLKKAGVVATVMPSGIKLSKDGVVMGSVGVKVSMLSKLMAPYAKKNPTLSAMAHEVVKDILMELGSQTDGALGVPESVLHNPVMAPTLDELKPGVMEGKSAISDAVTEVEKIEVGSKVDMEHDPVVPLRDATKMYQPVKGTDGSSRYFAVALSKGLNIAARYRTTKLSVRVEGTRLSEMAAVLQQVGFSVTKDTHASIHLNVSDDVEASKALGALIMGMHDDHFVTVIPNIMLIKGKGH